MPSPAIQSAPSEKRFSDASTAQTGKSNDAAVTMEAASGKEVDGVWGQLNDDGPNYKNLGWIRAGVLCTKCQIGLGVLAIPEVCSTFGMVPTILLIVAVAVSSAWCQIIIGMFKKVHPNVYSVADVGMILYGKWGREIFGIIYWINLTAIAGAGLIGFSTALNALSEHGACTVVFVLVAAICNFLVSAIQTLDKISFIGWIGLFGLMSAIITLTISVGVQDRPAAAPQTGPYDLDVITVASPTFLEAMPALSTIVFAYAGAPNYFGILAELRNPKDFKKTVVVTQTFTTMTYLVVGCVTYHFCGQYIASPALGSAGHIMKKVCYGLALPGLLVGAVLNTHIPAKYVFLRLLGKTRHLTENTKTHYIVWYSCVFFNTAISFIIAESIPGFDNIISLIGSALAINLTYTLQCLMWFALWRTWPDRSSVLNKVFLVAHILLFLISLFISVGGSYANGVAIRDTLKQTGTSVFSCADNSGST